jgi:hypothetical protein
MERIYFGHPVNTYNTPLEKELIAIIAEAFPEYTVENPNQEHHQRGYQDWKARCGNGMRYYFEEVLPKMAAGAFLPFEDGFWGAGVYGEAEFLKTLGRPIYTVSWRKEISLAFLDPARCLSIEATRERVYKK